MAETTIQTNLTPAAQEAQKLLLQGATSQFQQGPNQFFQQSTVAPTSQATLQGENLALSQIPGFQQQTAAGADAVGTLLGGGPQVQGVDPALSAALTNPIMQQLNEQILPQVGSTAVGQGAFGGSRQALTQGQAARGATGAITDSLARASLQKRQQDIGAMQGGLAAQGGNLQNQLLGSNILGDVGQQQKAREQELLNGARERFDFNQNAQQDNLNNFASIIQGTANSQQNKFTKGGGGFNAGGALGGAAVGNQLGNGNIWATLAGGLLGGF